MSIATAEAGQTLSNSSDCFKDAVSTGDMEQESQQQ